MKSRIILSLLWLFLLADLSGAAQTGADKLRDPLRNPAFVHFYSNEYDEALTGFEQQLKSHPEDPNAYNNLAQTIMYREMYRDGALESQLVSGTNPFLRRKKMEISAQDRAQFENTMSRSLALSEAALRSNPDDVNALYALAVAHTLRANYLFLIEKSWVQALHESIAGRKADDRLLAIDPDFTDAHLLHGLSEYITGCLPGYLRLLGAIRGFHGNKEDGVRELRRVAESNAGNRYDAAVLLAAIYRRERRPQDAIPLLQTLASTFPRNHLFRFEQVQMYSDSGDKKAALRVLAQIEDLRRSGSPGYRDLLPEKIQYLKANLLFWYGDLDSALAGLKQVNRKASELDLNTAVMASLRLGQVYDLEGDHSDASNAYQETIKAAPDSDAANEAKRYISKPYRRKDASP